MKRIGILGEYDSARESHVATWQAIAHASQALGTPAEGEWISSAAISEKQLAAFDGIWLAPGCVYLNQRNILEAVRIAREEGVPCLGTCAGFQQIVLEYARSVLGFNDAQSEEYDSSSPHLFITPLACSLRGRKMELTLVPGSRVERLYGCAEATERYTCSLGVNPAFLGELKARAMRVTGGDSEGEARVVELPDHPFFLGTLFVPQFGSRPGKPHPVVSGFLQAL